MRLSDFLTDLGRPVVIYPPLVKWLGPSAAILICQLSYWHDKAEGGWVYKSRDALEAETGLSHKAQFRARAELKKLKLLEEHYHRLEHCVYFRVNIDELNDQWDQLVLQSKARQRLHSKAAEATTPEKSPASLKREGSGQKGVWPVDKNGAVDKKEFGQRTKGSLANGQMGVSTKETESTVNNTCTIAVDVGSSPAVQAGAAAPAPRQEGFAPLTPSPVPAAPSTPPTAADMDPEEIKEIERCLKGIRQAHRQINGLGMVWSARGRQWAYEFFQQSTVLPKRMWHIVVASLVAAKENEPATPDRYYYCRQLLNLNSTFKVHPTNEFVMILGAAQALGMDLLHYDEEEEDKRIKEMLAYYGN